MRAVLLILATHAHAQSAPSCETMPPECQNCMPWAYCLTAPDAACGQAPSYCVSTCVAFPHCITITTSTWTTKEDSLLGNWHSNADYRAERFVPAIVAWALLGLFALLPLLIATAVCFRSLCRRPKKGKLADEHASPAAGSSATDIARALSSAQRPP